MKIVNDLQSIRLKLKIIFPASRKSIDRRAVKLEEAQKTEKAVCLMKMRIKYMYEGDSSHAICFLR